MIYCNNNCLSVHRGRRCLPHCILGYTPLPGRHPPVFNYRPQRSWAKVIFSEMCVKNSVHSGGGVSASVHAGIHPPGADPPIPGADTPTPRSRQPTGADTPPEQTPPGADTPQEQTPREQTHTPRADNPLPPGADTPPGADIPQKQTPPKEQTPPPTHEADSGIRSTSGRYASYWNAFLIFVFIGLS